MPHSCENLSLCLVLKSTLKIMSHITVETLLSTEEASFLDKNSVVWNSQFGNVDKALEERERWRTLHQIENKVVDKVRLR